MSVLNIAIYYDFLLYQGRDVTKVMLGKIKESLIKQGVDVNKLDKVENRDDLERVFRSRQYDVVFLAEDKGDGSPVGAGTINKFKEINPNAVIVMIAKDSKKGNPKFRTIFEKCGFKNVIFETDFYKDKTGKLVNCINSNVSDEYYIKYTGIEELIKQREERANMKEVMSVGESSNIEEVTEIKQEPKVEEVKETEIAISNVESVKEEVVEKREESFEEVVDKSEEQIGEPQKTNPFAAAFGDLFGGAGDMEYEVAKKEEVVEENNEELVKEETSEAEEQKENQPTEVSTYPEVNLSDIVSDSVPYKEIEAVKELVVEEVVEVIKEVEVQEPLESVENKVETLKDMNKEEEFIENKIQEVPEVEVKASEEVINKEETVSRRNDDVVEEKFKTEGGKPNVEKKQKENSNPIPKSYIEAKEPWRNVERRKRAIFQGRVSTFLAYDELVLDISNCKSSHILGNPHDYVFMLMFTFNESNGKKTEIVIKACGSIRVGNSNSVIVIIPGGCVSGIEGRDCTVIVEKK